MADDNDPTPGTKAALEQENARLVAENERLRGQLSAQGAPTGRAQVPQHTFQLSEGDRQELAVHGVLNVGGRLRTRAEVEAMLGESQRNLDLGEGGPDDAAAVAAVEQARERGAVRGVDFVYPSVAPGEIDPAVAGTPGINGPAATEA